MNGWQAFCEICKNSSKKVKSKVVHHITYKNVYNESMNDLMALCINCHKQIHQEEKDNSDNSNT